MNTNSNKKSLQKEPIAIIGMSCRFPEVNNLKEFWNLLQEGKETVKEISRWDIDDYYDPDKTAKDKTHQRHGSMFKNIDDFDPLFFNISPAEASEMNPSQKLMLELVWECIENSTSAYEDIAGKKVGVYIGNIWSDFEHLRKHKHAEVTSHSAVGQSANIIANRISFFYGLSGPSLVVDTGCSSSLVALHLACQSLWDGSIEQGIVGGVNHMLDPDQNILLSKFGGLSVKGKCSTFDSEADGFVRGEGGGVILIKTLSKAEEDGDKIYGIIRGTAINNNGFNVNLPATSVEGQIDVLNETYKHSGVQPRDIHYLETHGTGTQLGDPTETNALGQFFSKNRTSPLHIGSVKTNIGHLEGAAGMAGLIKTVLAINNKALPKNLNFNNPNPKIRFKELNLKVQSEHSPWPVSNEETLKAGVNSFGWGGTNSHAIIEEYKPKVEVSDALPEVNKAFALPLSARSEGALKDYVSSYKNYLTQNVNGSISRMAHTVMATALGKPEMDHRKLFIGSSKAELVASLDQYLEDGNPESAIVESQKVVFVFPGQGSQWLGMGKELYEKEPVFKQVIDQCHEAFLKYCDWSLLEQIHANEVDTRLNEINVIQPMLCAVQIALAKLWESFGIKPDMVTGHSMGEVAAAYISGSISLNEAAMVICTRSKLMKTVSGQGGAMAVTELTKVEAEEVVKNIPGLSLAVNNSPKSTVLAGDQKLIDQVLQDLEAQGKFCKQVKVDVASHSKQMDPLKEELAKALAGIKPASNPIPLFSTSKNEIVDGKDLNADYWVGNLRNGVQFAGVMKQLIEQKHNIFIEVSPHPVLVTSMNECIEAYNGKGIASPTLLRNKPETDTIHNFFDEMYQQGLKVDWNIYYGVKLVPPMDLPSYPFQRSTFSLTERKNNHNTVKEGHTWIGKEIKLANVDNMHFWESDISIEDYPYLNDHQVAGQVVLPGASYIEMLDAAVTQLTGSQQLKINKLEFKEAIILEANEPVKIQLKAIKNDNSTKFEFHFFQDGNWIETASGIYTLTEEMDSVYEVEYIKSNSSEKINTEDYYDQMTTLGLQYGPNFQGIQWVKTSDDCVVANIKIPTALKRSLNKYSFHPAVLDACLQTLFSNQSNIDANKETQTYLSGAESIEIFSPIQYLDKLKVKTKITACEETSPGICTTVTANITVTDVAGKVLIRINGISGKIFKYDKAPENQVRWHHHVTWQETKIERGNQEKKSILVFTENVDAHSDLFLKRLKDAGHQVLIAATFNKSEAFGYVKFDMSESNPFNELMNKIAPESVDQIVFFCVKQFAVNQSQISNDPAYNLVKVFKKLEQFGFKDYPKLTVVTNGASLIQNEHINLSIATVAGLSQVASNELPQYDVSTIDLSYTTNAGEMKSLVELIANPPKAEPQLAVRNHALYVARLEKFIPQLFNTSTVAFDSTGYHLVTGYKGIGLVFVEYMFKKGARNFCLISRSDTLSELVTDRIDRMRSLGGNFKIVACDVCDKDALSDVISKLDSETGIKSITHAAGVIQPQQITDLTREDLNKVLASKVEGAWNLHMLSKDLRLNHFFVFSSASSLLGLSGQASYVAANRFLDSLAQYRQRQNLPALGINWGVMNDSGMVAKDKNIERFALAEGFITSSMEEATEAFGEIANLKHANMGVFKLNYQQTAEHFPSLAESNYFKSLLKKKNNSNSGVSLLNQLKNLPQDEKLEAIETHIINLTADIIKLSSNRLSGKMKFASLGIDSLMAVQFRNRLEKDLKVKLSVADIWANPTIGAYSLFIYNKFTNSEVKDGQEVIIEPTIIRGEGKAYRTQLVCFHDAGGNATLFDNWESQINNNIELIIIELPGRGRSVSMPPLTKIKETVDKITDRLVKILKKPTLFFGHSMGGLVAFEVIREMRRRRLQLPLKLMVSSTPQLSSYNKNHLDSTVSDSTLTKRFPYLSEDVIPDSELRTLLITQLRNDLVLLSDYKYNYEPPLDLDIVAIHGVSDATVSSNQMKHWKNECTQLFEIIERDGDHHYLRNDEEFVTDLINAKVASEEFQHSN